MRIWPVGLAHIPPLVRLDELNSSRTRPVRQANLFLILVFAPANVVNVCVGKEADLCAWEDISPYENRLKSSNLS